MRTESHAVLFIDKRDGSRLKCFVDLLDLPLLVSLGKRWSADWAIHSKTYYVYYRDSQDRKIYLHRWLLSAPQSLHVDHKDHNGLNNQRGNIRLVTRSVNQLNIRIPRNNTSGFRGVTWNANRSLWQAQVKVKRRLRNLGCYRTKEEANAVVSAYRQNELGCAE